MENFRSTSCRDNTSSNNGGPYPSNMQDLRSFSTSQTQPKPKKNQIQSNCESKSYGRSSSKGFGWNLTDPELQRKKRVAGYKVYGVEGRMKGSLRKSFRWVKNTCSQVVYGWR